jgi:hypothetical protein
MICTLGEELGLVSMHLNRYGAALGRAINDYKNSITVCRIESLTVTVYKYCNFGVTAMENPIFTFVSFAVKTVKCTTVNHKPAGVYICSKRVKLLLKLTSLAPMGYTL